VHRRTRVPVARPRALGPAADSEDFAWMRAIRGAPPAGALRASKFAPGEFVTGSLRQTANTARG